MLDFKGIDKNLHTINAKEIIGKGTCLVILYSDGKMEYPLQEYCEQLRQRYQITVAVVSSHNNHIVHPYVSTFWPEFVTLGNPDLQFITDLKHTLKLSRTPEELKKLLRCQLLFHEGQLIYSNHQPVDNHHKNLLADKQAMKTVINKWGLHHAKYIMNQMDRTDQNLVWEPATDWQQATSSGDYYGKQTDQMIVRYLYFYKLIPNPELENALQKLQNKKHKAGLPLD